MNVEHTYKLLWWGGTCGILLIIIILLLRNRRMKKDLQQLRSLSTELRKDLQQHAAALSRSEQAKALFQQVVEELPDAVFITDPTECIQYSNKAARKNSGYAKEELLAQPISMLLPQITTEQQAPPPPHQTTQTQKKDGSSSPATVTVTDLRDPQGKVLGILFLLKDLRTIQQAEKKRLIEQQQYTERLRKSRNFETIGMMVGEVAHDLNNILSGVLHYPEQILCTQPENSPLRSPLLSLRHSGQQAVALVADLLSAAKAGSAVKEITDLNRVVEEILNSKECQDLFAERPGISLRVRLCPDPIPISCSPPHIRQCLYSLLLNGSDTVQAKDRVGTITVSVEGSYFSAP
ncbi:MAG: PAS domain-containing protein, partial [Candidatus Electrothrix sp. GM3_4]|nr:PAS domain-containing protein [Candidatus Electrothrix sp. GM3_4]